MGEAGHARVAEQFGVGRLLEGTLQAYRRAARMKPTAADVSSLGPADRQAVIGAGNHA